LFGVRALVRPGFYREFHQVAGNPISSVAGDVALVKIITHHRDDAEFLDGSLVDYDLGRPLESILDF
jgi:hypothetical protein